MMTTQPYQPLAQEIATTILRGFNRHFEIFQSITSGARERFEQADWRQVQLASRERIVLYDHRVEETIGLVKELYGIRNLDQGLWKAIKLCYMRLTSNHRQPELAETFYTSVFVINSRVNSIPMNLFFYAMVFQLTIFKGTYLVIVATTLIQ